MDTSTVLSLKMRACGWSTARPVQQFVHSLSMELASLYLIYTGLFRIFRVRNLNCLGLLDQVTVAITLKLDVVRFLIDTS